MDETIYECLMCKYDTPWLFAFQFHLRNHSDNGTFQYFDCFQELPRKQQIIKALEKQSSDGREKECGWSERKCDSLSLSKKYREETNSKETKQKKPIFRCEYCNSFKTFYMGCLKRHISKQHEKFVEEKSLRFCDYCPKKFKGKKALEEHLCRSHFASEVYLTCTKCPYRAVNLKDLKTHQECTGHGNGEAEKLYQCSKCLYGTDYKGDFEKHMLRRHTKLRHVIRWFKCTKCPYRAKENKHLTQHILNKHTKENEVKWFECADCGHKTKNKAHLRGHILNVHSDSRSKIKCPYCDYQSFYKHTVWRHTMKVHH